MWRMHANKDCEIDLRPTLISAWGLGMGCRYAQKGRPWSRRCRMVTPNSAPASLHPMLRISSPIRAGPVANSCPSSGTWTCIVPSRMGRRRGLPSSNSSPTYSTRPRSTTPLLPINPISPNEFHIIQSNSLLFLYATLPSI